MPSKELKSNLASVALQELWRDERFYVTATADRWNLSRAAFAEALCRSAVKRFGDAVPSTGEAASYIESLHLEDLALACACGEGNKDAWEHFFRNYRETLYAAARAIVGRGSMNEAQSRDLADSLYAELYGGNLRSNAATNETRHPLFGYFHGRSKLATWLRAILAQRYVDAFRTARRTDSLDETEHQASSRVNAGDGGALARASALRFVSPDPDRERILSLMQEALVATLASLPSRDRLRLALYYAQDLTLAQIGKMLGEHEATTSRHLESTRKDVRRLVEEWLRAASLSDAEVRLCFAAAQEEWPFDLTAALGTAAAVPSAKTREPNASKNSSKQASGSAMRKER